MKKLRYKVIFVGLFIDFFGSIIVGLLLSIAISVFAIASGDTSLFHLKALRTSILPMSLGLLGTTFCTGLGGYYAAKLSTPHGFSNSLAIGLISLTLGVIFFILQPDVTPLWKLIAGLILTVPAALAGGYILDRGLKTQS